MERTHDSSNPGQPRLGTRVAVIGAGLAGLVAANQLADLGHGVIVHEARSEPGGRARTDHRDGFAFNRGPHALYIGGAAATILAELGITMAGARPATKGLVLYDGRLHIGPADFLTLLRTDLLPFGEKLQVGRALARLSRLDPAQWATTPAADWVDRTVTGQRARELLHALIRLTSYVDAPDMLSAEVAVAQIQAGLGHGVLYLHGGWQSMVDQLAQRLNNRPSVEIRYGQPCRTLPDADAVIVATGSPVSTGRLVGRSYRVGPTARAACLDLGLRGQPALDFVLGVDEPFYLSNHAGPARLAPAGHSLVSCARYLAVQEQTDSGTGSTTGSEPGTDSATERAWLQELATVCGIRPEQVVQRRYLHEMTVISAIPTAELGGLAGRPDIGATGRNDVFVAGDWVGPTGHLADASVASARAAAMAAHRHAVQSPHPVAR